MMENRAQLWWATLLDFEDRLDDLESRLPADERRRAERFRVTDARRRFVLARLLLRRILADALGVDPAVPIIAARDRGKPHLVAPETNRPVEFNISHSGDVVVLALAPWAIGVDVECLRRMTNAERLARRFFSPAEEASVGAADDSDRDRTFLRIWTQKEATLKATGLGVGMPLRRLETEPDPSTSPRVISIDGDPDEARRWTLIDVEIPDAVCTVAFRRPTAELQVQQLTGNDLGPR